MPSSSSEFRSRYRTTLHRGRTVLPHPDRVHLGGDLTLAHLQIGIHQKTFASTGRLRR